MAKDPAVQSGAQIVHMGRTTTVGFLKSRSPVFGRIDACNGSPCGDLAGFRTPCLRKLVVASLVGQFDLELFSASHEGNAGNFEIPPGVVQVFSPDKLAVFGQ